VGGRLALDPRTSVSLAYTRFETDFTGDVSTDAPLALRALVLHPQTENAAADFLDAAAALDIRYHLVDADYRAAIVSNDCSVLNYLAGIRYARFEQDFAGVFTNAGTTELLSAGVDFE